MRAVIEMSEHWTWIENWRIRKKNIPRASHPNFDHHRQVSRWANMLGSTLDSKINDLLHCCWCHCYRLRVVTWFAIVLFISQAFTQQCHSLAQIRSDSIIQLKFAVTRKKFWAIKTKPEAVAKIVCLILDDILYPSIQCAMCMRNFCNFD